MKRSRCLAAQTIIQIARQRPGFEPEFCRMVFEHLDTAEALARSLREALAEFHLSELQFGIVVVLYSLDPEPIAPADLAEYAAVSRPAVTEALDHLEDRHLVVRARNPYDRRVIRAQLTDEGRAIADPATNAFLRAIAAVTRLLNEPARNRLLGYYALLQAAAPLSTHSS